MTSEPVMNYGVEHEGRQKWAWNIILNGKTIARCNSESDARKVADSLRMSAATNDLNTKLTGVQSELRRLADL